MKAVLTVLVGIVLLLVALVVALPFLIDLNKYQDQYRPIIEEALNRKISLQDIRLTIWPRIGARITGFTVQDDPAFSTGPFASLKSLDVGVKLGPLLSKRVEVEEITLREPVITVIKNQNGVMNVSTMGPKRGAKPEPSKPEEPRPAQPAGGPLQALAMLAVDQLSIKGAKLTYRDLSAEKPAEYLIQDFELLLQSVRLGASPSLNMSATVQPFNLPVGLKGTFGPLVETPDIKNFDFLLSVGKVAVTLTGSAVGGNLDVTAKAPVISTADLPIKTPLTKPVVIKDLLVKAHAVYPPKPGVPPLEIAEVQDLGLVVALGASTIQVKGTVLGGHAQVTANSAVINTNDLPVDVPLKKPVELKDFQLAADMKDKDAHLSNLSVQVFDGQITSQGGATLGTAPMPFNGKVSVKGLQLGPLLEAVGTDKVSVSGSAATELAVQGRGFTMPELTKALEGTGHFLIKDAKLEGINLLQEAMGLMKVAGIPPEIVTAKAFASVEGDMRIQEGVIQVQRLIADSHDYQAMATGTVGFDKTLNLKANLNMSEGLSKKIADMSPAARIAFSKGRMTIPLIITGTAQAPSYSLDAKAIGGKVQEQVKEKLQETLDDALKGKKSPKDLQKQGQDLLKDFLGR